MLAPFSTQERQAKRRLAWLGVLLVVVATTGSCGQIRDKSTDELITIVQAGEYDAVRGRGPVCDAAYNLGLRKATEGVDALIAALSTKAVDCVARALGQIGDLRAVGPLLDQLHMGNDDALTLQFLFREDKSSFNSADEALVSIGAPAVDALLAMAAQGDDSTRDVVTYVLGRIRDPRAETFLLDQLKAPGATADTTALLAADALVRTFGDGIDRLLPLLQSNETVAIAYGLVGLGQPGSEAALRDALMQFGDLTMANFYLNAGNPVLKSAALEWGGAHGYQLALPRGIPGSQAAPPAWGDLGNPD